MGLGQFSLQAATLRDFKSVFVGRRHSLSHSRNASGCARPIAVEDQISRASRDARGASEPSISSRHFVEIFQES
jgi:hypothetical protein